ncbi:PQ loop repeat-domain-containing protein [Globomyces pollinis-pini]|nr:PQ loop repeat-domain-containing protein [Globomyces pollinis-pini]
MRYTCPPNEDGLHSIMWIEYLFHECIYTPTEEIALFLGYISIGFWLFAQFPQLWINTKKGNSDSLSVAFLFNWLLGDFCNLIGCLLTGQQPFQTYLAAYFVFIDSSLLLQCIYFRFLSAAKPRFEEIVYTEESPLLQPATSSTSLCAVIALTAFSVMNQSLDSTSGNFNVLGHKDPTEDSYYQFGRFMAWCCTCLYLSSRLPQIYWNFKRRSCDGLAIVMFMCAVMGNITYAASILTKSWEATYLYGSLPYLIGSIGTVSFDFIIFSQYLMYDNKE